MESTSFTKFIESSNKYFTFGIYKNVKYKHVFIHDKTYYLEVLKYFELDNRVKLAMEKNMKLN